MRRATIQRGRRLRGLPTIIAALCALCVLPAAAQAKGAVTLSGNAVRIPGAAGTKNRSVWARRRSLVLVLPPMALAKRVEMPKGKHPLVRGLRVHSYPNRSEIEVRLNGRAEAMMARVRFADDGHDLLMRFAAPKTPALPPPLEPTPPPAPRAQRAKAKVQPKVAAAHADGKPAAAAAAAKPDKTAALAAAITKAKPNAKRPAWIKNKQKKDKGGSSSSGLFAGLVLAIGAALGWFFMRKRQKGKGGLDPHIDVIASRSLAGKQRLVLVEVSGELMLLGVSEKGIELLRSVSRDKADDQAAETFFAQGLEMDAIAEAAALEAAPAMEAATSFLTRLEAQMDEREVRAPAPPAQAPAPAPAPAAIVQPEIGFAVAPPEPAPQLVPAPAPQPELAPAPQPRARVLHDEASPLDEAWAERVLELRRARERGEAISLGSNAAATSYAGPIDDAAFGIEDIPRTLH